MANRADYSDLMGEDYSRGPYMKGQGGIGQRLLGSRNQTNINTQPTSMGTPALTRAADNNQSFDQYVPEAVVSPEAALQRNMQFQGNPKFVNNPRAVANADLRDTMNQASQAGVTYKGNPAYQGVINNYLDRMAPNRMNMSYNEEDARRRLGTGGIMVGR